VHGHLAENPVREQALSPVVHRDGCLVARAFNSDYAHKSLQNNPLTAFPARSILAAFAFSGAAL
jgi:hypothetical protein